MTKITIEVEGIRITVEKDEKDLQQVIDLSKQRPIMMELDPLHWQNIERDIYESLKRKYDDRNATQTPDDRPVGEQQSGVQAGGRDAPATDRRETPTDGGNEDRGRDGGVPADRSTGPTIDSLPTGPQEPFRNSAGQEYDPQPDFDGSTGRTNTTAVISKESTPGAPKQGPD